MKRWAVVGLGVILASCGGHVVVDRHEAFGGSWDSFCDTRATACGLSAAECKAQEACAKAILRDETEAALLGCLVADCNQDACFAAMRQQFSPSAKGAEFLASHETYLKACPNGNDDIEIIGWIGADVLLEGLRVCMDAQGCAEIGACIDQLADANWTHCVDWL